MEKLTHQPRLKDAFTASRRWPRTANDFPKVKLIFQNQQSRLLCRLVRTTLPISREGTRTTSEIKTDSSRTKSASTSRKRPGKQESWRSGILLSRKQVKRWRGKIWKLSEWRSSLALLLDLGSPSKVRRTTSRLSSAHTLSWKVMLIRSEISTTTPSRSSN